ncbi:MAG: hypothetical protein AAB393_03265 [Bacteroidota bacterium]
MLDISSNKLLNSVGVRGNPLTNIVVWWTPPGPSNVIHYDGHAIFSNPP